MKRVVLKWQTAIAVALALTVAAWAGGIVRLFAASAQTAAPPTTTSPPTTVAPLPSGPPAPSGFADTVKRIYAEGASYAGLPGKGPNGQVLTTSAPMSTDAFNALIDHLTRDQLNALYDYKPDAWPRVDASMKAFTQTAPPSIVASQIGQAQAASANLAPPPAPKPALSPGGVDYVPPEAEVFQPPNCPSPVLGPDDGYDLLFGFDEAHDIAAIPAQPFLADIGGEIAGDIVATLLVVAYALEIPALTTELLISTSTFCSTGSAENEKEVIDQNLVNLDNTSIAMLALDKQVQDLEGKINQLLDTRTQTIVGQLNTAQASLDKSLQQSIEESLQGGGATAIGSYELPASLGGYLNSTPIGVQAIVTNAMSSLQQAKQSINPTATSSLNSANNALAAGQYKQAFTYFQAAYQALTK
jgi:TolA-binding protein